MKINRVLIVGLGSIGKRHLRLARELLPNADIRVLRHQKCNSIPEQADGCFIDINRAIEFKPQLAVIANPATYHMDAARPLAAAGVHLLVEKPLSSSVDRVSELLDICRKKGVILLTGYNLRFLPSLQKYHELINEHVIGKVLSVRAEIGQYLPSWRPDADYRNSVSAQKILGGGALLELSHELDYLRWIFGEVDWVMARLGKVSDLEIDVEDNAHLILGFKSKVDDEKFTGTLTLDFVRRDTTRSCTAIGENGSLRWNGLTGTVDIFEADKKNWREVFHHQDQRDDSYLAEWHHILACIQGHETPLITGEDGLRTLQVIDMARLSSDRGKSVLTTNNESPSRVNV